MTERPDLEELKKRRVQSLEISKKAAREHSEEYRELKQVLRSILSDKIDVSDYYTVTNRLCRLLQVLVQSGAGSVFYYFYQNIDPKQAGEVRFFRAVCSDLLEQLDIIDRFRTGDGRIRRIK